MSLFVEHVLFGINTLMPEFENLVKKYTLHLAEVSKDVISPLPCFVSADHVNYSRVLELSHIPLSFSSAVFSA